MAHNNLCNNHEYGVEPGAPLFFDPRCHRCVELANAEEAAGMLGPALRRNAPAPKKRRTMPYVDYRKVAKNKAARAKYYAERPERL